MSEIQADIQLFNETDLDLPISRQDLDDIARQIQQEEDCTFSLLEIVFVDEPGIIAINKKHLDRDYITDIITFRYDEQQVNREIEGTLYCCAPRIKEQAAQWQEPESKEFFRIVIHGLLHLSGYEDATTSQKKHMTDREDHYLATFNW